MSLPVDGRAAFYILVEHGQSLERIAQTYRVTKREIVAANNLAFRYSMKPGTLLEVPLHAANPVEKAKKSSKIAVAIKASPKRHQTAMTNLHPARLVMKPRRELWQQPDARPRGTIKWPGLPLGLGLSRPGLGPPIIPLDERPDNLIEARSDEPRR